MSAVPADDQVGARDIVAGLLATASIFVGAIGIARTPVAIIPGTVIVALVAARMAVRYRTLALWAVGLNIVWWLAGMTVAVTTNHALF